MSFLSRIIHRRRGGQQRFLADVDFRETKRGRWRWYLRRAQGQPSLCQSSASFATKLDAVANYLECARLTAREWKESRRGGL